MDAPGHVPESINCQACDAPIDLTGQTAFTQVECARCGALSVVPLQFGNLLLLNTLGIGGMGTVYKALDLQLTRYVAVKILRAKYAGDPSFIEIFAREARAAAAVNHPNVAQVYAFGAHDGQYYLTMELLERGSLDDRITKLGKLPEADVLAVGTGIAAGLNVAHQRGLLHRDIKPGNILFNDENIAKLVDFGLAGAQHEATGPGAGTIWGTPYYIAPEKLRGQPEDFHSDMYSLGATLFHAVTGRPPFDAKTAEEVLAKQATTPAFNLKTYNPNIQDATSHAIGRMLAKEPTERFATYDALIEELQQAEQRLQESQSTHSIITASGQRISVLSIVNTMAAIVATVGVIIFLWHNRAKLGLETSPPPAAPPPIPTNIAPVAVAAPVEIVSFTEPAAWAASWTNALAALAHDNPQSTLNACENLRQLTRSQPRHQQWVELLESISLFAAGRASEAAPLLKKIADPRTPPVWPVRITPTNDLAEPFAAFLLDAVPAPNTSAWPAWATGFTQLLLGLKQLAGNQLDAARDSFDHYRQLPVDPSQRWAFTLQPLAKKIADEIRRGPVLPAEIDQLQAAGKLDAALKLVREARIQCRFPTMREQFDAREAVILKAQQLIIENNDAGKRAAEARQREAEARQREAEAQAHRQADSEAQQVVAWELPVNQYEFAAGLTKLDALANKLTTAAGKTAAEQRRAVFRRLTEFKQQLASDFAGKPFDVSRIAIHGVRVNGKLTGATDAVVTNTLSSGEMLIEWRDLTPETLVKMAQSYAQPGKPAIRARRYLLVALFAKQFNLKFDDDLKLVTQLDPTLQPEVDLLFGK